MERVRERWVCMYYVIFVCAQVLTLRHHEEDSVIISHCQ